MKTITTILFFILFGVCLIMATNMYFHLLITPLLLLVCVLSGSSIYLINKK